MKRRFAMGGWRAALPLVVVVPMLALASALGTPEIIFPEGAALVMGIWVMRKPGWSSSRWRVAVLPGAFAFGGVALLRLGMPTVATAIVAVTLALLALQALDSRLGPAMSAAVLPIVFDVEGWSYPLAVVAISLVVAAGMGRCSAPRVGRYAARVMVSAWLVVCAWLLVGGALLDVSTVALAPPLFVSALEWLGRGALAPADGVRRWTVLVGAGLGGAAAVELVSVAWVAGALAVVATLALMRVLKRMVPPALAIAIIPQIVESTEPLTFGVAIAVGAGALLLGTYCVRERAVKPAPSARLSRRASLRWPPARRRA